MAYQLDKGYTDTITTAKNVAVPDLDWEHDFSVKSDTGSEVIMVNTTSPIDRQETFRFSVNDITNIYNNSQVDQNFRAPSKQGVGLLVQKNSIARYSDASDLTKPMIDFPISANVVIKVPKSSYITADDVLTELRRTWAGIFDTGSVTYQRLSKMLRGALDPRN